MQNSNEKYYAKKYLNKFLLERLINKLLQNGLKQFSNQDKFSLNQSSCSQNLETFQILLIQEESWKYGSMKKKGMRQDIKVLEMVLSNESQSIRQKKNMGEESTNYSKILERILRIQTQQASESLQKSNKKADSNKNAKKLKKIQIEPASGTLRRGTNQSNQIISETKSPTKIMNEKHDRFVNNSKKIGSQFSLRSLVSATKLSKQPSTKGSLNFLQANPGLLLPLIKIDSFDQPPFAPNFKQTTNQDLSQRSSSEALLEQDTIQLQYQISQMSTDQQRRLSIARFSALTMLDLQKKLQESNITEEHSSITETDDEDSENSFSSQNIDSVIQEEHSSEMEESRKLIDLKQIQRIQRRSSLGINLQSRDFSTELKRKETKLEEDINPANFTKKLLQATTFINTVKQQILDRQLSAAGVNQNNGYLLRSNFLKDRDAYQISSQGTSKAPNDEERKITENQTLESLKSSYTKVKHQKSKFYSPTIQL
eukprot:403346241